FDAAHEIYRREAPALAPGARPHIPTAEDVTDPTRGEIEKSGLFGGVAVRRYHWELVYSAESYVQVLNTYSGHRKLEAGARERLFRGIRELINGEFDGQITKGYMSILYLARLKDVHQGDGPEPALAHRAVEHTG